jgi:hypothetical protein
MRASFNFIQKLALLVGLAGLIIIGVFLLPPIPQDAAYHQFADKNSYLGVSNFWNVLSNLPFLLIGLLGVWDVVRGRIAILSEFRVGYLTFFIGVALVGPGSAYYHLTPDNASLLWDRLPMTVAFMALFVTVIAEYLSVPAARRLLWPLVSVGIFSVFYWYITELNGYGDLRLYVVVQFLPILLMPLILLFFQPTFSGAAYLWAMIAAYAGAKLAESLDEPILRLLHFISGHSIKHLLAALGAYYFWMGLRRRKKLASD